MVYDSLGVKADHRSRRAYAIVAGSPLAVANPVAKRVWRRSESPRIESAFRPCCGEAATLPGLPPRPIVLTDAGLSGSCRSRKRGPSRGHVRGPIRGDSRRGREGKNVGRRFSLLPWTHAPRRGIGEGKKNRRPVLAVDHGPLRGAQVPIYRPVMNRVRRNPAAVRRATPDMPRTGGSKKRGPRAGRRAAIRSGNRAATERKADGAVAVNERQAGRAIAATERHTDSEIAANERQGSGYGPAARPCRESSPPGKGRPDPCGALPCRRGGSRVAAMSVRGRAGIGKPPARKRAA